MARFLIEVPNVAERVACARVVEIRLKTGSHLLMGADWGASTKPGSMRKLTARKRLVLFCLPLLGPRPRSCS